MNFLKTAGESVAIRVFRHASVDVLGDTILESTGRKDPMEALDNEEKKRVVKSMLHTSMEGADVYDPFVKILFGTTVLSISHTLRSYGIKDGDVLTCVFTHDTSQSV